MFYKSKWSQWSDKSSAYRVRLLQWTVAIPRFPGTRRAAHREQANTNNASSGIAHIQEDYVKHSSQPEKVLSTFYQETSSQNSWKKKKKHDIKKHVTLCSESLIKHNTLPRKHPLLYRWSVWGNEAVKRLLLTAQHTAHYVNSPPVWGLLSC